MSEEKFFHKSVLVEEVLHYLSVKPCGTYLDVTFGSGGHTRAILEKEPKCSVIALDWDSVSLETYGPLLQEEFPGRLKLIWGSFSLLYKILKKEKIGLVDGILADFGTSQMQIVQRPGFSFRIDTPLDMRMSPGHQKLTAEQVLKDSSELKLSEIFWQLGQERYSRQIAHAIVRERKKKWIKTTRQLAEIVEKAVPRVPRAKREKIHPATRVFQALRIYINKELDNIHAFLPASLRALRPGGRLVCISFHSLEDRIVKNFFKEKAQIGEVDILTPKVIVPSEDEVLANPASRSAKLRAIEVVDPKKIYENRKV